MFTSVSSFHSQRFINRFRHNTTLSTTKTLHDIPQYRPISNTDSRHRRDLRQCLQFIRDAHLSFAMLPTEIELRYQQLGIREQEVCLLTLNFIELNWVILV